jgi:hypothetical protein
MDDAPDFFEDRNVFLGGRELMKVPKIIGASVCSPSFHKSVTVCRFKGSDVFVRDN